MKNLQEWADFYVSKDIWVFPHIDYSEQFHWLQWRNMNDNAFNEEYDTYDWNSSEGINVVTGKKGVLILTIFKDKDEIYALNSLLKVLSVLRLPNDYDWVIEAKYYFSIVIHVHSTPMEQINKKYKDFYVHYGDSYILPPGDCITNHECHFKNGLPVTHPQQLSWSSFSKKITEMEEIDIVNNPNSKRNIRRKRLFIGMVVLFAIIAIIAFFYVMAVVTSGEQLSFLETAGVLAIIIFLFLGGASLSGAFN